MAKSWTKESDWVPYFRKMSNAELLKHQRDSRKDPSRYRGTVLPKVVNKEIARRKQAELMRTNAGKPRKRSFNSINRGLIWI